jgi:preprotein translocase subunit SecB
MAKTPKKDAKTKATEKSADDATIDESNLNISVEGDAPAPDAPDAAAAEPAPQATGEPMLTVLGQYTRDMSFENPNAPDSLKSGQPQPEVSIDLRIGRQISDDNTIEISILVKAHATRGDQTVFLAELDYAGLFAIKNVGLEQMQPLMMIECPRLLFPYARKILADMTQDGGHLPIMLDMPDFASMYREEMMRRGQEQSLN